MAGFRMEMFRMGVYIMFPVLVVFVASQPLIKEKIILSRRVVEYPPAKEIVLPKGRERNKYYDTAEDHKSSRVRRQMEYYAEEEESKVNEF